MGAHLGVNVAINEEQAIVDEMIVDTSLALVPETMGLSLVALASCGGQRAVGSRCCRGGT